MVGMNVDTLQGTSAESSAMLAWVGRIADPGGALQSLLRPAGLLSNFETIEKILRLHDRLYSGRQAKD
jgi:hypothetical protein